MGANAIVGARNLAAAAQTMLRSVTRKVRRQDHVRSLVVGHTRRDENANAILGARNLAAVAQTMMRSVRQRRKVKKKERLQGKITRSKLKQSNRKSKVRKVKNITRKVKTMARKIKKRKGK